MTQEISGFGVTATLIADKSFPTGFTITQFADDSDPLDMAAIQIAETAMGLNGDLLSWARATVIPAVIAVVPNSEDDLNLSILADLNRVGQGKVSVNDVITLALVYPDGRNITLSGGKLTMAPFGNSISSQGRIKTKVYTFAFQNKIGS